jgi:hypothetical protein
MLGFAIAIACNFWLPKWVDEMYHDVAMGKSHAMAVQIPGADCPQKLRAAKFVLKLIGPPDCHNGKLTPRSWHHWSSDRTFRECFVGQGAGDIAEMGFRV